MIQTIKKKWQNFWKHTQTFTEIDSKIWTKYKKTNGFFQKLFFIKDMINQGKTYPALIFSMTGEYATILMICNWLGYQPKIKTQILGAILIATTIITLGYLSIFFEVTRKEKSWANRYNPEQQKIYKQIQDIHDKLIKR